MTEYRGFVTYDMKWKFGMAVLVLNILMAFNWNAFGFLNIKFGVLTMPIFLGLLNMVLLVLVFNKNLT